MEGIPSESVFFGDFGKDLIIINWFVWLLKSLDHVIFLSISFVLLILYSFVELIFEVVKDSVGFLLFLDLLLSMPMPISWLGLIVFLLILLLLFSFCVSPLRIETKFIGYERGFHFYFRESTCLEEAFFGAWQRTRGIISRLDRLIKINLGLPHGWRLWSTWGAWSDVSVCLTFVEQLLPAFIILERAFIHNSN